MVFVTIRFLGPGRAKQHRVGFFSRFDHSHLLSGIAATGDDGNTANLEELHFDCWSGREGGGK